jgi:hypothetical protein
MTTMDTELRTMWAIVQVIKQAADALGGYLIVPGRLVPRHLQARVHPLQKIVTMALTAYHPDEVRGSLEAGGYDAEQVEYMLWLYRVHALRESVGPCPTPVGGWTVPTTDRSGGPTFGL